MYDKGKILIGIGIFIVAVLFPFWFGAAQGGDGTETLGDLRQPDSVFNQSLKRLHDTQGPCVRDGVWMRGHHMSLLDGWRDEVVRGGAWKDEDSGRVMSLTRTCLGCHSTVDAYSGKDTYSGNTFCMECHDRAGVEPNCWECHNQPGES